MVLFWLRDYMSLRMGPSRTAILRSVAYGIAVVLTAVFIWRIALTIGLAHFPQWLQSPRVLLLFGVVHLAASTPSIWVRQTQNYHWMWVTALLPAPVVWLLLLQAILVSEPSLEIAAVQFSFFSFALLWAASMVVVIFRSRYMLVPPDDLDFAVLFGSVSHGLALCTLPLALLFT